MQLPPAGGIHDDAEIEAVVHVLRTSNLDIGESVAALEAGVANDRPDEVTTGAATRVGGAWPR